MRIVVPDSGRKENRLFQGCGRLMRSQSLPRIPHAQISRQIPCLQNPPGLQICSNANPKAWADLSADILDEHPPPLSVLSGLFELALKPSSRATIPRTKGQGSLMMQVGIPRIRPKPRKHFRFMLLLNSLLHLPVGQRTITFPTLLRPLLLD